ncbi:glycosyltransferase family 39 protein [Ruegeria sp. 2205SS24-7]|uniref:ArnT family glycosyltransferase n=1 Tax=Ruegeria discodermiae TaxID=3064389 RepID=UPI002740D41A|nr:glycosyltransferase family 39 protein [Ruegeria sp. 2205SS24-7]MDP5218123.1 glycosyltransferase family 39 protein [Ruegeria sp. 2205SS24-7]
MVTIDPSFQAHNTQPAPFHTFRLTASQRSVLFTCLAGFLIIRVLLVFWLPITDTTEARYAEIARKMVETGNWITPQFDYGVPFWAKPPLHTWATALGMKVFGVGHFGARVPILLLSMASLAVTYSLMRYRAGADQALIAVTILTSSLLFFGASAFVMTDMALVLGTTLCMTGFFVCVTAPDRAGCGYLFFFGLAVGLLAKGPVALVLTGIPIFLWLLIGNRWPVLKHLPWRIGLLLTIVLSLPWYLAAEAATPGYLRYFLIGEHIERFLVSGWQGDLYGNGHAEPKGMIWVFALGAFLPWSLFVAALLLRPKQTSRQFREDDRGWYSYLLLWCLSPLILFTPAANILPAYVLPALPAAALLLVSLWTKDGARKVGAIRPAFIGALVGNGVIYLCLSLVVLAIPERLNLRSEKDLIEQAVAIAPKMRVTYWGSRSYSAEFYSAGAVRTTEDPVVIERMLFNAYLDALAVEPYDLPKIKHLIESRFQNLGRIGRRHLFVEFPHAGGRT